MKTRETTRLAATLFLFALIAAVPLFLAGCGGETQPPEPPAADTAPQASDTAPDEPVVPVEPDSTAAASEPVLRTGTKDEVRQSLSAMSDTLPLEARRELNEAFAAFARDILVANPNVSSPELLDTIMLQALREFDGMTAAEMLAALPRPEAAAEDAPAPPAGAEARHGAQNVLKIWGLVGKMFANEQPGERYPALSAQPGVLFYALAKVYPEYLTDLNTLVNPAHPRAQALGQGVGEAYESLQGPELLQELERIGAESYCYLGYAVTDEAMGLAFAQAYRLRMAQSLPEDETGLDADLELLEPHPVFGNRLYRLREGIERFFITDINDPAAGARAQASIPVLFEWPTVPGADINVLYLDGHVATVTTGTFPNTEAFLGALEELKAPRQ